MESVECVLGCGAGVYKARHTAKLIREREQGRLLGTEAEAVGKVAAVLFDLLSRLIFCK